MLLIEKSELGHKEPVIAALRFRGADWMRSAVGDGG
jgi:hypothetical protein